MRTVGNANVDNVTVKMGLKGNVANVRIVTTDFVLMKRKSFVVVLEKKLAQVRKSVSEYFLSVRF